LHAVLAFAAAAKAWRELGSGYRDNMRAARDAFEMALRDARLEHRVLGANVARLPNTSSVLVPGVRGEALLTALDLDGVAVSHGAACASGGLKPSHVLSAMGLDESAARSAVRVSFGPESSADEGRAVAARFIACAERLRSAAA
jgi:cysteine desulfurase